MVHFDPQSDNRKCLFAKKAKIGGAGDSCEFFFQMFFFFMAKWCHQMFVCAKSKIILLFSIFLKHKFDAKLPWLHTKKWSLLELSSERFGAILPRFGALFKSELHSMEYGPQYSNTKTHFT